MSELDTLDREDTLYVEPPWAMESRDCVERESQLGDLPPLAVMKGREYFLEVSISTEIVEDLAAYLGRAPTLHEKCERLIEYATTDA